ncbi:NAD(P)-dependent dehydrogenase (short-subunit alcohol dehydrogenase family) [Arthrobacter sp. JUb115]|nr:NAD(P)-dependent dehydrogenase (short-subunit alcohol dehydrogenase family) [Arthrobacter sp. JUb115]
MLDLGLSGKTVLVTGATQGIGASVAKSYAAEGCNIIAFSRSESKLRELELSIRRNSKVSVATFAVDLRNRFSINTIPCHFLQADILVNVAGDIPKGDLVSLDESIWRNAWDLKVFGYINLTRAVYGYMKERSKGSIVNIIGTSGENPNFDTIAVSSANAALISFTKSLAGQSHEHNVRVNGINPGPTETPRQVSRLKLLAHEKFGDSERWRDLLSTYPFRRLATPSEIASATLFLSSEQASYISGSILTIDGGRQFQGTK